MEPGKDQSVFVTSPLPNIGLPTTSWIFHTPRNRTPPARCIQNGETPFLSLNSLFRPRVMRKMGAMKRIKRTMARFGRIPFR